MSQLAVTHIAPVQLNRARAHLFKPCLAMVQGSHTSQTNQTLGVKCARAQYGLPSVSTPLHTNKECKTHITFSRLFFVAHLLMPCRSNIVLAKIIRACFVCSCPSELSLSGPGKSSPCQQSSRQSQRDSDCSSW